MGKISIIELKVPNLGDAEETEIIEISVSPGDDVNLNDPILVLESEKAAMEIPSDYQGKIKEIHVKEGDQVQEGMVYGSIEIDDSSIKEDKPPSDESNNVSKKEEREESKKNIVSKTINVGKVNAGPAVRKYARELDIDLSKITGSGKNEQITKEDLKHYIHQSRDNSEYLSFNESDFSKIGNYKVENQTKIQALAAKNLHQSWVTIPHVTHYEEVNMSSMMKLKESKNVSILAILVKATTEALIEFPLFNSSLLSGSKILIKDSKNIGIAVDTKDGLIVPVIHDADSKSEVEISKEIQTLAEKSRTKKLLTKDMEGATFTLSSLGKIGGIGFTPIINPPEVGILGVSRSTKKLTLDPKGGVVENEFLPISLSYDHRVINGADAGKFMLFLKQYLEKTDD